MYKGKKILGTMVMDLHAGRSLGRVKNIILDLDQKKITALILPGRSWLHSSNWLDINFVREMGTDVLIIDPLAKVFAAKEVNDFKEHLQKGIKNFWGLTVISNTGKLLGYIEDFFFSLPGGQIEGINLSRGVLGDLLEGWGYVPAERVLTLSSDCLVIQGE